MQHKDERAGVVRHRRIRRTKYYSWNLQTFPPDPRFVFEEVASDLKGSGVTNHGISTLPAISAPLFFDKFPTYEKDIEGVKSRPPLYPVAWGWNSGGRAGNLTESELYSPGHVQRSVHDNYVTSAAGGRHSLLVSETGTIWSFGEGREGQLGYGNQFNDEILKGNAVTQYVPREVTPSGIFYYGSDMKAAQVACGSTFSLAREVTLDEGIDLRYGLRQAEEALLSLKNRFEGCETLQQAWASVRQERFIVGRVSRGTVIAWGTGGELAAAMGNSSL